jgi:hypothetical protein
VLGAAFNYQSIEPHFHSKSSNLETTPSTAHPARNTEDGAPSTARRRAAPC